MPLLKAPTFVLLEELYNVATFTLMEAGEGSPTSLKDVWKNFYNKKALKFIVNS